MSDINVLCSLFGDNYVYLLVSGQEACVIDPIAAEPVEQLLNQHHLTLKLILNTHHHFDHVGGNTILHQQFGCPVIAGSDQIQTLTDIVLDGEQIPFGPVQIHTMATPGHTRDSVSFYLPGHPGLLFSGDTLFIGGCGNTRSGATAPLWSSLQRLAKLPDDTLIYPGHEYTLDNFLFLQTQHPDPAILRPYQELFAQRLVEQGHTCPSTLAIEKKINVFLQQPNAEAFSQLRQLKDHF